MAGAYACQGSFNIVSYIRIFGKVFKKNEGFASNVLRQSRGVQTPLIENVLLVNNMWLFDVK